MESDFLWARISVAEVGAINFAVSFALALSVAFRAKMVKSSEQLKLLFAVLRRFQATPIEFFIAAKPSPVTPGEPPALIKLPVGFGSIFIPARCANALWGLALF